MERFAVDAGELSGADDVAPLLDEMYAEIMARSEERATDGSQ